MFRISRARKVLENAVLLNRPYSKKGQSSESGFSAFFRMLMLGRHKFVGPRRVFGSVRLFLNTHLDSLMNVLEAEKYCKTQHFVNVTMCVKTSFLKKPWESAAPASRRGMLAAPAARLGIAWKLARVWQLQKSVGCGRWLTVPRSLRRKEA